MNGDFDAYRLHAAGSELRFARLTDDLLHVLAPDQSLAVGDASWSYTLTRVGATAHPAAWTRTATARPLKVTSTEVLVGRSPCQEMAKQLGIPTTAACNKLKWRLTLNRDPAGAPTTYRLENTLFRSAPRSGRWAIVRDPQTGGKVYRLDATPDGLFVSLLAADTNVFLLLDTAGRPLVGNEDFSYTLNRVQAPAGSERP